MSSDSQHNRQLKAGSKCLAVSINPLVWVMILALIGCQQDRSDCVSTLESNLHSVDLSVKSSDFSHYLMGVMTFYTSSVHEASQNSRVNECQALIRIKPHHDAHEEVAINVDYEIITSRQCLTPKASQSSEKTPLWVSFFVDQDPTETDPKLKNPGFVVTNVDSDEFHQLAVKRSQFSHNDQLKQFELGAVRQMMNALYESDHSRQLKAQTPPQHRTFNQYFHTELCQTTQSVDSSKALGSDKLGFILRRLGSHQDPLGISCYLALDLTMFRAQAQLSSAQLKRLKSTAPFIPISSKSSLSSSWFQFLSTQRFKADLAVLDDVNVNRSENLRQLAHQVAQNFKQMIIVPRSDDMNQPSQVTKSLYMASHHHALSLNGGSRKPLGVQTHPLSLNQTSRGSAFYINQAPWGVTAVQRLKRQFMDDSSPGESSENIHYHQGGILVAFDVPVGVMTSFYHDGDSSSGDLRRFMIRPQDYLIYPAPTASSPQHIPSTTDSSVVQSPDPERSNPQRSTTPQVIDTTVTDRGRQRQSTTTDSSNQTRGGKARPQQPLRIVISRLFPPVHGTPVDDGVNMVHFRSGSNGDSTADPDQGIQPPQRVQDPDTTPITPPPISVVTGPATPRTQFSSDATAAKDNCTP